MATTGGKLTSKGHPLYNTWSSMIQRCTNPNRESFPYYGGRGIYVCREWMESFDKFLEDMGPRPEGYTLDRVDNNGPYTSENCRWLSRSLQKHNSGVYRNSKSGIRGVNWNSRENRWVVRLYVDKVCHYGGKFTELDEAITKLEELKEKYLWL